MDTIRINPLIVSVDPTAETMISPIAPTHHGGFVKKVLPIVAAILIPIAAPAITSAVAASGVLGATVSGAITSSAVAATAASAVTGAALGAVTAKVTGQDVKAGAIGGALGGGIGGYATAAATPGAGLPAVTAGEQISNISNLSMPLSSATPEATGLQVGSNEAVVTTPTGEAVVVPASATGVDAVADSTAANLSNNVSGATTGTTAGTAAGTAAGTEVVKQTALQTAATNLKKVPSLILSKVTDPATIASLTLQAGAMIAGTALVPETEMDPELVATLENYKDELLDLKGKNEAAYNEKMAAAKEFMNQANYYDPEYFAQQAAANAAIAEGRKLTEFQRAAGLQYGGLSPGELRRASLAGGQRVQSAYDQGFQTAVGLRDRTITTGVGLIPAGDTTMANAYANLANLQLGQFESQKADDDAKRANISAFFNKLNLTSGLSNQDQEDLDEEKDSFNNAVLGNKNNQQGGLKLGTIT